MRVGLIIAALLALVSIVEAGDSTLTYTAAQSNAIQTRLIPGFNRTHCRSFHQPPTCATADLARAGCRPRTTSQGLTTESCVIFTADAVGEQAFLRERSARDLVIVFGAFGRPDPADFCAAFRLATQQKKDQLCANLGLPAGCTPCK